jgi:hypothetical protein
MPTRRKPSLLHGSSVLCLVIATLIGCGYPAAEPENLRLITSLRTALSARNETWLNQNEELIEKRYAEKTLGEAAYQAFKAIVNQARAGEWKEAELEALKFQRAQRPTQKQEKRLPERRSG